MSLDAKPDALAVALAAKLAGELGIRIDSPPALFMQTADRVVWPIEDVIDLTVAGPDDSIPIRLYRPSQQPGLPVLVYLHGGGWFSGDLDLVDANCRELSARVGCLVISVDYSLSPSHKFPRALTEVHSVCEWAFEQAASFGGDPGRIAIGGESVGANLAAAECLLSRGNRHYFVQQLLLYPVLDPNLQRPEIMENEDPILSASLLRLMWRHYTPLESDWTNPLVAPSRATSLKDLPPAIIITGGTDPLRAEGEAFADALRADHIDVFYKHYVGLFHGFFGLPHPEAERAMVDVVERLRGVFGR